MAGKRKSIEDLRAPWKTREAVKLATLEWVALFNHHRLLEPMSYIAPAEAEANYYRQLTGQFGQLARQRSAARAKAEHPFLIIKRLWGLVKVRYAALRKMRPVH